MIEFFSSASVICALMGIMWVVRCKKTILSMYGIFSIVILAFAIWNFVSHGGQSIQGLEEIINSLFIIITAGINVHYTHVLELTVNLNRRKENIPCNFEERREQ